MAIGLGIDSVLVIGSSKTGLAVTEALVSESVRVAMIDDSSDPSAQKIARRAEELGATVHLGDYPADVLDGVELVIPTPSVPPRHPTLVEAGARSVPIWSEIELGWRFRKGEVLAVTGTNGKTTTTMLLARMLLEGGFKAVAAGNIGFPLITAARESDEKTVIVAEVSSFQLRFAESFRPVVGVVLNVADDHLDWHEGPSDYLAAKARITRTQTPNDHLVVRASEPGCAQIAAGSRARLVSFGLADPTALRTQLADATGRYVEMGAGIAGDRLAIGSELRTYGLMSVSDIRLQGPHNIENVLAAAAGATAFGVDAGSIARASQDFEPPPHRMRFVARKEGVTFIDDSKATNPHAAVSGIAGLEKVVLIAGGQSRGIDLAPLASVRDRIKALVVMGESADEVAGFFEGIPTRKARDVEDAVALACDMAEEGDTVLLSPAFPSQDQYRDYAERGERFAKAVLS